MVELQQALDAGKQLREHPYTVLGLSDREKFHTGFLFLCLRDNPAFYEALFKPCRSFPRICVVVEEESRDLTVKSDSGDYGGVAEVKLKTDLHDDQLSKKYQKKVEAGATGLVIGLFPPIGDDLMEMKRLGFRRVGLTEEVPDIVAEAGLANKLGVEEGALLRLWIQYLTNLGTLKSYFVEQGTNRIDEKIVDILKDIKLKGIFERYRHGLVASKLQDLRFRSDLPGDGSGKGPIDIGNSHGNGILDFYTIPRLEKQGKSVQMGLQWQAGLLKVFVYHEKKSDERDKILRRIAKNIHENLSDIVSDFDPEKLNKDGNFRSVTLMNEGWDVLLNDISEKHKTLQRVYSLLDESVLEVWKLDLRSQHHANT